ncbi:MAG TPA: hypothetical protein PLY32_04100 [Salinivirgaceae bacterium]|nr:hypothetical protein [Salinivirgaceae bacterium]
MKTTPKFWSNVFDALIVLADFIIGKIVSPWFNSVFSGSRESASNIQNGKILCGVYILLAVMYVIGLLINKVNFRAEKTITMSSGDNMVMGFNIVAMGGVFTLLIFELFPATINVAMTIILSVGFMVGYGWLHYKIIRKESPRTEFNPSLKRKIIGFFLVFPFVISLSLPVNALVSEMTLSATGESLSFYKDFVIPVFIGLILATLAWFLFFIPRKMLKAFVGVDLRCRAFFWALLLDYSIKVSPFNIF